jgi:hypothetical protein
MSTGEILDAIEGMDRDERIETLAAVLEAFFCDVCDETLDECTCDGAD